MSADFTINPAWATDPELFEKFLCETDVFGHCMCDDAKVAARERKREELIEEFLRGKRLAGAPQQLAYAAAKSKYFKEMV